MSIAAKVQQCFGQFRLLQQHDSDIVETGSEHRIEDEFGRFKIWCGNLSAHRPTGGRSLEHRLRDSSNLKAQVIKLLDDLSETLSQQSTQRVLPDDEVQETSSDNEDDESLDFEFDDMAIQPKHPSQKVHEIVNLLYHFSMALRHPTGHDRILAGVSSISNYSLPFDLDRVRSKYPQANEVLQDRLGRAMSTRRQYLKYREEHHAKLAAGLEKDDDTQSTLATSVHEIKISKDLNIADEIESVYSMTSFALTESDSSKLRPPALPESGERGDPFECPLCYSVQQFTSKKLWNQHVYEDLQPYCCTINECSSKHKLYSRRRDWQRHQTKSHNSVWVCPFSCSAFHTSSAALETHLATAHGQTPNKSSLQRILDASARPIEVKGKQPCPLCDKVLGTVNLWFKHVGRHMEQLALSSLPSHLLASESDEELEEGEVEADNSLSDQEAGDVRSPLIELSAGDEDKLGDDIAYGTTDFSNSQEMTSDYREDGPYTCWDENCTYMLPNGDVWRKTFNRHAYLERHIQVMHDASAKVYRCSGTGCKYYTKRKDRMRKHYQEKHGLGGVIHGNDPPAPTEDTLEMHEEESIFKRHGRPCTTCRKRKKTCDGEDPICKRCIQDGFHCEGYVLTVESVPLAESVPTIGSKAQPSYEHDRELSEIGSHSVENNNGEDDRTQLEKANQQDQVQVIDVPRENYREMDDPGLNVLFGPATLKVSFEENIQRKARETSYSPEFYGRVDRQAKEAESEGNLDDSTQKMFSQHARAWDYINQSRSHAKTQVETEQHRVQTRDSSDEGIPMAPVRRPSTTTGNDEKEEQKVQAEMRRRLQSIGYTDKTIDTLIDEEKAKQIQENLRTTEEQAQTHVPTYPKIHSDYLAIETLDHYQLPWEYDRRNPGYIIINRDMDKRQTDILFEHTARLHSGQLVVESSKRKGKEPAS